MKTGTRGGGGIRGGLTLPLGQFQKAKALGNLNPFPHPRGNKEKCVGEASGRQRVFIIFVLFAIVFYDILEYTEVEVS